MVRLEVDLNYYQIRHMLDFNSTMVRLEDWYESQNPKAAYHFNSTMVRLEV